MIWLKIGSLLMFIGVGLGAFGAHALRARASAAQMDIYKTAVMYHLIHALGLCALAWLATQGSAVRISLAGSLFIIGIVLFSGSLYFLAITGQKWIGAITPLGGVSLLAGWLIIFVSIKN